MMKERLIKLLGGYTKEEYDALRKPESFEETVKRYVETVNKLEEAVNKLDKMVS